MYTVAADCVLDSTWSAAMIHEISQKSCLQQVLHGIALRVSVPYLISFTGVFIDWKDSAVFSFFVLTVIAKN